MGQIIIHAGMPKTGSSSIQRWLTSQRRRLRNERNTDVLVWRANRDDPLDPTIDVQSYTDGRINSSDFIHRYSTKEIDKQAVVDSMIEGLDKRSQDRQVTVSTGEILARPFVAGDPLILSALEALAARHTVRVAYYIRPQHTAMEAAWRQWGYRSGLEPSTYLARRTQQLDYLDTLKTVRMVAPSISFEMRPFRSDLLIGGDIVLDFCSAFLSIAPEEVTAPPALINPGLPLDLVNALRHAPRNLLWKTQHDNKFPNRIKRLIDEVKIPETVQTALSRIALQQYCHDHFETGNRRVFEELAITVGEFVPAVPEGERLESVTMEMFDEWWKPQASESELALLYRAISVAVGASEPVSFLPKGRRPPRS